MGKRGCAQNMGPWTRSMRRLLFFLDPKSIGRRKRTPAGRQGKKTKAEARGSKRSMSPLDI